MNFDLDKLILPLATSMVGLIPVLINITVNWVERKGKTARLNNLLQQNNQRVAFLQVWFGLQKEVSTDDRLSHIKGVLSEELEDIYETFTEALLDTYSESNRRHDLISQYKRTNPLKRFFLFYAPYNAMGWLFHTLYYMCILPIALALGYIIYTYVQTKVWLVSVPQEYIMAGIALVLLLFVFRWFGRMSARDVEARIATIARKTAPLRASGDRKAAPAVSHVS